MGQTLQRSSSPPRKVRVGWRDTDNCTSTLTRPTGTEISIQSERMRSWSETGNKTHCFIEDNDEVSTTTLGTPSSAPVVIETASPSPGGPLMLLQVVHHAASLSTSRTEMIDIRTGEYRAVVDCDAITVIVV
ncbi:hypothetical protein C8T65DRAFT_671877 [Cerioporus squamosus]|nr:hypothetical protein C8T65DRAFT_671877 [Cerioporus squamosus]